MKFDQPGVTKEMFQQTVYIDGQVRVMRFSRQMMESILGFAQRAQHELLHAEKVRTFKRNKAHDAPMEILT